jgi:hypothetical protein
MKYGFARAHRMRMVSADIAIGSKPFSTQSHMQHYTIGVPSEAASSSGKLALSRVYSAGKSEGRARRTDRPG